MFLGQFYHNVSGVNNLPLHIGTAVFVLNHKVCLDIPDLETAIYFGYSNTDNKVVVTNIILKLATQLIAMLSHSYANTEYFQRALRESNDRSDRREFPPEFFLRNVRSKLLPKFRSGVNCFAALYCPLHLRIRGRPRGDAARVAESDGADPFGEFSSSRLFLMFSLHPRHSSSRFQRNGRTRPPARSFLVLDKARRLLNIIRSLIPQVEMAR